MSPLLPPPPVASLSNEYKDPTQSERAPVEVRWGSKYTQGMNTRGRKSWELSRDLRSTNYNPKQPLPGKKGYSRLYTSILESPFLSGTQRISLLYPFKDNKCEQKCPVSLPGFNGSVLSFPLWVQTSRLLVAVVAF